MIKILFSLYRRSPFVLRGVIARIGRLVGLVLRPVSLLEINGYRMAVDFSDNACFKYAADKGEYEATEMRTFLRAIEHVGPCVVIDVGANYGAYALAACDLISRSSLPAKVLAIEPDRRPAKALRRSLDLNGFGDICEVLPIVSGESEGSTTIWINARSSADNRTHSVTTSKIRVRDTYGVPTSSVDAILSRHREHASALVVKMDIQGNEPRAFRGMEESLRRAPTWFVLFEHAPYLIRSAGLDVESYADWVCNLPLDAAFRFRGERAMRIDTREELRSLLLDVPREDGYRGEDAVVDLMIVRGVTPDVLREVCE